MKIGIAGTGMIARETLLALSEAPGVACAAICGRRMEAAAELAEEFGISQAYDSYPALLGDPLVDTVYVGVPNSVHYSYAAQALESGKHVICEKPFTSNATQTRSLIESAHQKDLFLWEAITLRHNPNFHWMREQLPRLGLVKLVQCNFSQYSSRYDRYLRGDIAPVFDLSLHGGALYDINIYNLHLVIGLFGPPEQVRYFANIGHNGVDTSGVVILRYPGFLAECVGAKDSAGPNGAVIQGERGTLILHDSPSHCTWADCQADGVTESARGIRYPHRMTQEFVTFERMLRDGDRETCQRQLAGTLAVMEAAETARLDAGLRFPDDPKRDDI